MPSTRVILTFYDVMWNWWKREFLKSGNPLSFEQSEVVVVPIQTGGGIRIKILEAGAAQRPVVATRIGADGLPIVPGMHAIIADSADDIVAGIRRLFHDRPFAQQLATNLHDLVEHEFDWDKLAKQKESAFLRD